MDRQEPLEIGLTHAGGVVCRPCTDHQVEVLLIRASTPPFEWVLPKGHIERGETAAQAAHREVLEETGVEARVGPILGTTAFVSANGESVRAVFFLMPFKSTRTPQERREVRWCSVEQAISLTPFEDNRVILRAVEPTFNREQ